MTNVTELRPGAKRLEHELRSAVDDLDEDEALEALRTITKTISERPTPPPNSDDSESNILIECDHMSSTLNLLRSAIDSDRVKIAEYDMRAGTVINALWSLEYGLDRIKWLVSNQGLVITKAD